LAVAKVYGAHLRKQAAEECTPPIAVVPSTLFHFVMILAPPSLQEQKRRLRAEMRDKRRALENNNKESPAQLADIFLRHIRLEKDAVVASYCAVRDEMDPAALNEALRAKKHKIALPVITGKRKPLIFRLYEPGDRLLANPLSILEPSSSAQGVEPDVLLIPLLAFDRERNRLGYGGGYYDRTIKELRARKPILAFGIAYACQEVAEIPTGPNDIPLDRIVTEINIF
jgi:5-formyltetrahydrofolate cyclo-ligase